MAKRRAFQRTDRLNSRLREVLSVILHRETREELLHQVVVNDVEISRDLSFARVYYYPMDSLNEDADAELDEAFARATGFIRSRIGQEVRMRQIPELRFIRDVAVDRGRRVDEILSQLKGDGEELD